MVIQHGTWYTVFGLHGLHAATHSHFHHSQTAGSTNHHTWQNGETIREVIV